MDKPIKTYTKDNLTLKIYYDDDAISPRDGDNLGTMVCFHKRYSLGDKHDIKHQDYSGWIDMKHHLEKEHDVAVILPLFLYDHSGITMNTTGFHCTWDSGQVGFIYISKQKVRDEYGIQYVTKAWKKKIEQYLLGEVEEYDKYLRGEVYGYRLEEDGEEVDACWGFFGSDPKTNGIMDNLWSSYHDVLEGTVAV